jgi:anti-sigma regulatory factor (Ser/Thr protein kinase)
VCDQVAVELPATPASTAAARHFVAAQCGTWALGAICDELMLPVSELVSNAVLHARTPTTVTVSLTSAFVEVSVRDGNPRPPVARPVRLDLADDIRLVAARRGDLPEDPRDLALHVGAAGSITAGRGLHIVDAFADEWGVSELTAGKEVWFRIGTPTGWTPATRCRCSTDASGTSPGGLPLHVPAQRT